MDERSVVYITMGYYSISKRKEILQYATSCIRLEDIKPSEINQWENEKYCVVPLRVVKITKAESITVVSRAGVGKNGELLFHRYRYSVLQDEKSSGDEYWWWLHNNVKYHRTVYVKVFKMWNACIF